MKQRASAAQRAKWLLGMAARQLNTASPAAVPDLSEVLDASLYLPPGDPAYRSGQPLLQPRFTETAADNLSFVMDAGGPGATPKDRIESVTQAMSRLVNNHFGSEALHWFRRHCEPAAEGHQRTLGWGAWFGTGLDRNGLHEAQATYEWGPALMDSLPAALYRMARVAVDSLPGLRPAVSAIRCGRSGGSQQITFEIDQAMPLMSLEPLLKNLGLGHQHASLMSATALVLGARFTLPPNTSTITLQPLRNGVEFRLDVILDALPDPPQQLHSLLRMQMAERPRSLRALDRWMMALTPDGYPGPGQASILSVWVRPEMSARVALYLRPAALEGDAPRNGHQADHHRERGPNRPVADAVSTATAADWSAWTPQ
jgi:hypothetical protein